MLLSDFIGLSAEEKMVILMHDGTVVARRRHAGGQYFLFQLDHFYAEVVYGSDDDDPAEFRCFTGTASLAPYLEAISLDEILR
ncbi:hypothetical protein [Flaviaesturariibacter aridisoli]|uniref:Uncharacterized protein n=1 Tax=Flaviaesturariibacter aridisoli TaxID=2545761 RepID=A0A4R4E2E0_9BACT|nr:hypothetical protein [Flaviaesturariibacter aridisoli]TCZ72933.1 hypothetical protein E0486_07665 [Flaviaesturariibacter aridisoli]